MTKIGVPMDFAVVITTFENHQDTEVGSSEA